MSQFSISIDDGIDIIETSIIISYDTTDNSFTIEHELKADSDSSDIKKNNTC